MSHLILHIGTHKTGTTTIQDTLWKNAGLLKKKRVIYPRLDYPHSGHHGLIAEEVGLGRAYRLQSGGIKAMAALANRYAGSEVILILSSEEFSRAEPNRSVDFDRLRWIFDQFHRVTVICFLRPQWRFLQSIYLEISKHRSPPRPPDLIHEALSGGLCQGLYMDYSRLLDRLEKTFSSDEIKFVDFETVRKRPGALVDAVLNQTRAGARYTDLKITGDGHSNRSAPALSQWMANLVSEPYAANAAVQSATRDICPPATPSTCLTRAEVEEITAGFHEANRNLIARRAGFQPDFQLTDPTPPPNMVYREDISIEDWLRVGQRLARTHLVPTG